MNRNELNAQLSTSSGVSKAQVDKVLDGFFDLVANELKAGRELRIVGFGSFSAKRKSASTGRNPRTGKVIAIKASNRPKFKASKTLVSAVN